MQRIKILRKVVLAALAIIVVRLFFIQIVEHDVWVSKASEQHTMLETIAAKRGEIYMMDSGDPVPVVLNQTTYSVVIDPAVTDKDGLKSALEKHAPDKITANIDEVFNTEGLRYYIVARGISHTVASEIANEGVAGVWFKKSSERIYPEGEVGSSILGFVNADGLGQYGVEGSLNNLLSGKDGLLKSISDVNNVALSIGDENVKIPAEDGKNVVLSVDRGLERGIEDIAMGAINSTAATDAAVLVMDPNSGEVVAMSSLPGYDPANYGNVKDASAYINQVTEVPYEPASICKSFAFSAAINEGKMDASTTYFNNHYETVDGWKIENAEKRANLYGTIDMKTALYWSLNTGSIYALKLLGDDPNNINQKGREKLYDYYHNKFRLGRATGIELIEAEGYIEDPNEGWGRDSTYANMTFGQNLGITMIQTATAFSAVVNGGFYHTPSIVRGILEDDKTTITPLENAQGSAESNSAKDGENLPHDEQILSSETSSEMRAMLINNRNYKVRGGIDRAGYDVGGKSGTAQVIVDGAYDNSMSNLIGSYIGFVAPSGEMPEYVIMVKMWGEGQALSGGEAGELFDKISNYVIDYLKIKPNGV